MTTAPGPATFTIVGTLAYLALAVLGWGGFAAFFSHPARIALTIAVFVMSGVALFSGGNLSRGEREDRSNRWVLVAFAIIGLLAAYLPAYTDRKEIWTLDGDTIRWLGVALFAAGGALRLWPVFVLGRRFSGLVAIQPGHTLVTTGIYGVIRHPSYLGLLVNSLGWALAFRSGVGVLLTALTDPAAPRAHARGRSTAAHTLWRRIRCVLHPHVAADSRALLRRSAKGPVWVPKPSRKTETLPSVWSVRLSLIETFSVTPVHPVGRRQGVAEAQRTENLEPGDPWIKGRLPSGQRRFGQPVSRSSGHASEAG